MRIAVTGATGHLGRLVIDALLARGVPAGQLVAVVRDTGKAAALAARGVQVRHGGYDRPDTLASALAGTDKVLLVSGSALGQRVEQHRAVVDAAAAAGVGLLAYTSIPTAATTALLLAAEHRATEERATVFHRAHFDGSFVRCCSSGGAVCRGRGGHQPVCAGWANNEHLPGCGAAVLSSASAANSTPSSSPTRR